MNSFFSIIIPVYNVELYLNKCLDSVINQDYSSYEIICINDGSTDNSLGILHEYASKHKNIRVIDQENKGLSSARNTGIQKANGCYLFFLDSDDWIEENALEILANNVGTDSIDMLCFKGKLYHEADKRFEVGNNFKEEILSGWTYYNKYALIPRKFHFVTAVLRLYRKEFLLNNKLLFKDGFLHEDNLFTPLACYYARTVKIINATIYNYRIRSGSITQSKNFKRITDKIIITNDLSTFFIPIDGLQKNKIYTILASDYIGLYLKTLNEGSRDQLMKVNNLVNFRNFRKVCLSFRHKFLFGLIYIHPILLLLYYKAVKLIR